MARKNTSSDQILLPGTVRCHWQEGAGKRWYPALVTKDLGDTFLEVEVDGMGRRLGTTDRAREYPGYVSMRKRRKRRIQAARDESGEW